MNNKIGCYLITEELPQTYPEIVSKGPFLTIKTTLQDFNINRNKRLYSKEILLAALEAEYIKERLACKTWFGEFSHPRNADVNRQLSYDIDNLSHIVTHVFSEDNRIKAIVEAANTKPTGENFAGLVRQGCKLGFSMRGLSDVIEKRGEITVVKGPLIIFCYDLVINPSHQTAFIEKVLKEDLENLAGEQKNILQESGFNIGGLNINKSLNDNISEYVKSNSKRIKNISEQLEFNPKVSVINEKQVKLEGKHNMVITVEDFIANNYKSYLRKF